MSTRLQRSRSQLAFASAALFVFLPALRASEKNPVIVHEWGTFTSLQDEKGNVIGGINEDDEPAPYFVHQYASHMVIREYSAFDRNFGLPPYGLMDKSWATGDPNVTMRLETPVIYIYPPKGQSAQSVPPLDVHVDFHGGVLSEFYPYAETDCTPQIAEQAFKHTLTITADTVTSLTWKDVKVGTSGKPFTARNKEEQGLPSLRGAVTKTTDKVWTTPRETSAPLLGVNFTQTDFEHPDKTILFSEAEHFLFYRGVAHLESPFHSQDQGKTLGTDFFSQSNRGIFWKVEIWPDGRCAFRGRYEGTGLVNMGELTMSTGEPFTETDFSKANLDSLKSSMQEELVRQGLYADEASAMLRTWDLSYFKGPGLRIFYIVPAEWMNRVLPLKITGAPVKITRVMIGRLELVSSRQRAALQRLAAGPCPDLEPVKKAAFQELESGTHTQVEKDAFYSGVRPLRELGIAIPPLVQDYLDLGRFRDALILHEQQTSPSPALAEFISKNRLVSPVAASTANPTAGVATASAAH